MTETDACEWQVGLLDMDAYLERIAFEGTPRTDADTLRRLHRAHLLAIPFENFDIILGRSVDLDLTAIQTKLVTKQRGGYCFEHGLLFAAAAQRIGFTVHRLGGRMRMGSDRITPRTHTALLVTEQDDSWLADVGVGSAGPLEPMPWVDGLRSDQGRWSFRLDRISTDDWVLRSARPDGWFDLYSVGLAPQHHIDFVLGNHYVSTHPHSPFVGRVTAGRSYSDHRVTLSNRNYRSEAGPGDVTTTELTDEQFVHVIEHDLAIHLDDDEKQALVAASLSRS